MLTGKNLAQWWTEFNGKHGESLKNEIKMAEGEYVTAPTVLPDPYETDNEKIPDKYFFIYYVQDREDINHKGYFWSICKDILTDKLYLILKDKKGIKSYGRVDSVCIRAPMETQLSGIIEKDLQWADFLSKFMIYFYIYGEDEKKVLEKLGKEEVVVPEEEIIKYMEKVARMEEQINGSKKEKEYSQEELQEILRKLNNGEIKLKPNEKFIRIDNDPRFVSENEP